MTFCDYGKIRIYMKKWFSLNQRETYLFFEDIIIPILAFSLLQEILLYYPGLLYCLFIVLIIILIPYTKQTTICLIFIQLYKVKFDKLSHLSKYFINVILLLMCYVNGYFR